ncbi:hypothetical protein CK203_047347 [Vitis vinifera]|uniref:Uncharacterized protein n=1 Tax=Vitis vinifera TaxID=29760 RepID=A0A438HHM9_VITVI|nr:hypothetical protein CK203_047347 [Vitis vinifera]
MRSRSERWRMGQTLRGILSREGSSLTFLIHLTQISSLRTCMEELALVHDTRFYSMEERIDQYQIGFTSRFEHFQQRFERIEERMDQ